MFNRKQAWAICNDLGADLADFEQDYEQASYLDGQEGEDGIVSGADVFRSAVAMACATERQPSWLDVHYSNFAGE